MDILTGVYLCFAFLGFYYFFLFFLIYIQNRKFMFERYKPKNNYSLSIVIPCYNGEDVIGNTIEQVLKSDYNGLKKVIVVDDCSKDNSYKIAKQIAKKDKRVLVVQTPKNTGCAAGAKNYGSKFANTDLIGFTDDDSYPSENAISEMVGFFNDKKVGAVTSRVLVRNRDKFLPRIQSIEYKIIAFTRKLFGFVESIYVTNGPLSIYRMKAFEQVKGFDEKNMTEDIEITWHFVAKGWKVHISLSAIVYTVVPDKFKAWLKQRLRWNVGGIQTLNKYKGAVFKVGMLGLFILPYFFMAWVLGIFGLFLLMYRFSRYLFVQYLATAYSIESETSVLRFNELNLSPTILFFFGILLLSLGIWYNFTALSYSKKESKEFKRENIFNLVVYMFIYLLLYPIVLIASLHKFLRKDFSW